MDENKMSDMDSSDGLSGDWDIINSAFSSDGEAESSVLPAELASAPDNKQNDSPVKAEKEPEVDGSGVQDLLPDSQPDSHCDSNASSDIDIIDEVLDDILSASDGFSHLDDQNPMDDEESDSPRHSEERSVIENPTLIIGALDGERMSDADLRAYAERTLSAAAQALREPSPGEETYCKTLIPSPFQDDSMLLRAETSFEPPPTEERSEDRPSSNDRPNGSPFYQNYVMPLLDRLLNNVQWLRLLAALMISFSVVVVFNTTEMKMDTFGHLKENIGKLQAENAELRNQITSKMENDKLLFGLKEQISSLKYENSKLGSSMKSLLHQLGEQTEALKKDRRGKGPYKEEFEKLREQINILRIDNDELQNMLVRMRYATYPPSPDKTKEDKSQANTVENNEDVDNSSDILSEEIKELKSKLFSEVEKLKDWKETIVTLVNQLNERQTEIEKENSNNKKDDSFDRKKSFNKRENREKSNLDEAQEKLWNMAENLKAHMRSLHDMDLSKYIPDGSKKNFDGVYDSMSHFLKKVKDKSKKVFEHYSNDNKFWSFLGDIKKEMMNIKNNFIERNYGKDTSAKDDMKRNPDCEKSNKNCGKKPGSFEDHKTPNTGFKKDKYEKKYEKPRFGKEIKFDDLDHDDDEDDDEEEDILFKDRYANYESSDPDESDDAWTFERAKNRERLRQTGEEEGLFGRLFH